MTPILVCNNTVSPARRITRARGFTLLEIMLVLAILALASLIVVPKLTGLESRSFTAQVREAHSLLNYARRIAVVSGQPSTATFQLGLSDEDQDPTKVARSSIGKWYSDATSIIYRDSAGQETDIEDMLEITFYPEGGSTGGTLELQFEQRVAHIKVDPTTGRINTEFIEDF